MRRNCILNLKGANTQTRFVKQADSRRRRRRLLRHVGVGHQRWTHHLRLSERQIVPGQTQVETEIRHDDGYSQRVGQQQHGIQASRALKMK